MTNPPCDLAHYRIRIHLCVVLCLGPSMGEAILFCFIGLMYYYKTFNARVLYAARELICLGGIHLGHHPVSISVVNGEEDQDPAE